MLSHRDFLLHPTSMQSLVSSSAGPGGASNPGLRITESLRNEDEADEDSVYCDLTRPAITDTSASQQQPTGSSARRERTTTPVKRCSYLRSGLLAAFVLILLGVIVTSTYAIDRRLSQMPQLLYGGLGLCSIGFCLIVVCISLLVARQLAKHQQRQRQRQRRQSRHSQRQQTTGLAGARGQRGGGGGVPIWYIGCHRDTATAYCPPVPPSYWESTSTSAQPSNNSASPKLPQQHRRTPPPAPPPPPPLPPSRLQRQPVAPPSYQEALRCLEHRAEPNNQISVLRWTVQSQQQHRLHHHRLLMQQQQPQQLYTYRSFENSSNSIRRSDSSSFIGEPILV